MLNETLLHEIDTLSPDYTDELLDFIAVLRMRHIPACENIAARLDDWWEDTRIAMSQAHGHSGGKKWTRSELYRG